MIREGDIVRTLPLQTSAICFIAPLVGAITIREIHSISQVMPQLGKMLRMDGKIVGFFRLREAALLSQMLLTPNRLIKWEKVTVAAAELLTTNREWAGGRESIFAQEQENSTVEVYNVAPGLFEWQEFLMKGDLILGEEITWVVNIIEG